MKVIYLGLGSNIGDREKMLRTALAALDRPDLHLRRVSSLYETEPIGLRDQPWFLNLAAEFETDLAPGRLLQRTQDVERQLGRERSTPNAPRTIDIDILLYDTAIVSTTDLEIPHPPFRERRFTLAPLAELSPALRDPVTGKSMVELLAGVSDQIVTKLHA